LKRLKNKCASAVCCADPSTTHCINDTNGERNNIKRTVPRRLKRKFANPALFAYKFNLEAAKRTVMLEPRFAPKTIGIATSIGIIPPRAKITTIPETIELEWTIIVRIALTKYAIKGFERCEKKSITPGLSRSGPILVDNKFKVKISNTIEQLGDLGNDFSKVFERMHTLGVPREDVNVETLTDIYNRLIELFRIIEEAIQGATEEELQSIKAREEEIYAQIRQEFDVHVHKLQQEGNYRGNIFVDAVSIIELSVSKTRDIRKILLKQVRDFSR